MHKLIYFIQGVFWCCNIIKIKELKKVKYNYFFFSQISPIFFMQLDQDKSKILIDQGNSEKFESIILY
jgi:hypothetical protein